MHNPCTQKAEVQARLWGQGKHGLHSEFQANQALFQTNKKEIKSVANIRT